MGVVHVAGHPALDFIGTLSERGVSDVEELTRPAVLSRWWIDARVMDEEPAVSDRDLSAARTVRESMYRVLRAWTSSEDLPLDDVQILTSVSRKASVVPELDASGRVRRAGTSAQGLSTLAASLLNLMHDEPRTHIRWCADDQCTHPFLDSSRGQRRRWCDMATCGTRHKQRAFRARQSPHRAEPPAV